ncbi:hypothetical protein [Haladaptatus sp. YSMS36]|uniref:hypothetical protein n=1 Tax=Haladaptatus sp. YSMS36 TaxID=3033384 RepID=UPI0023E8B7B3|nr:hypothetical protein [Haladaptatus sp. YSMS36]
MIFLTNRAGIRNKRLHRRIKNRLQKDTQFSKARVRVASPREPGPYRAIAETNPRTVLGDSDYPTTSARVEIGFDVETDGHDHYWFNYIEPDRSILLGWHQDSDHADCGPVHLQVNEGGTAIEHKRAQFIDEHPMAVVTARLEQLPAAITNIEWENGSVVGLS